MCLSFQVAFAEGNTLIPAPEVMRRSQNTREWVVGCRNQFSRFHGLVDKG